MSPAGFMKRRCFAIIFVLGIVLCSPPQENVSTENETEVTTGFPNRQKRQLSEIVYTISSGARLLIGAGVGFIQSIGRLGMEVIGESDGGLLGFLGSLFAGLNASLDLVRNILLAVLGTKDILLGTPTKDELAGSADASHVE